MYIDLSSTSASDLFAWISVLYTLIFSILFEILVFYQSSVYSVCIKPYTFVFSIFNILSVLKLKFQYKYILINKYELEAMIYLIL